MLYSNSAFGPPYKNIARLSTQIALTKGQVALVDAEDYEWLSQWKWYAQKNSQSRHEMFYAQRQERVRTGVGGQRPIPMHRAIMGLAADDGRVVDHINGDTLDNRRVNLRVCEPSENFRNRKLSRLNTTGSSGVTQKANGRWTARIGIGGKRVVLGSFASKEEAQQARAAAEQELYGEFTRSVSHVV